MIEMSTEITKLSAALVKAQGAVEAAVKDGENEAFKRKGKALGYATLESVIDAAKPAMQAAGLAFTQAPGVIVDGALEVTTMIIHGETGQWMRSTIHVPLQQRTAQGVGSAITYARRYALMSVLGIPAEDDDGHAASEKPATGKTASAETQKVRQSAQAKPEPVKNLEPSAGDVEHAERLISQVKTAEDLADLWKTPWVQDIARAGGDDAARLREAKDQRKAELTARVLQAG